MLQHQPCENQDRMPHYSEAAGSKAQICLGESAATASRAAGVGSLHAVGPRSGVRTVLALGTGAKSAELRQILVLAARAHDIEG